MRGSRINAVIRELRGEKIDIIQYSDDIVEYTINALNPARISKVLVQDPLDKVLEVIVPEDQLSLAIGRKGQNVRLGSKLLGWEINIKSEEDKKQEILAQMEQLAVQAEQAERAARAGLEELEGLGDKTRSRLQEANVQTIEELSKRTVEDLTAIPMIGEKSALKILALAEAWVQNQAQGAAAETAGEAEAEVV